MKRIGRLCAVVAVVLGLAGPAVAAAADLGQLKAVIGTAKTFSFLPGEFGKELGVWTKRGLDVQTVYVRGSGQVAQTLAAGQADVALTAGASGLAPILKGLPAKFIGEISRDFRMMVLVVPKGSGAKTAADLRGKAIGITSPGSLTDWLVDQLAAREGWVAGRDVRKAVAGGLSEQLAALKTGATDAFVWSAEAGFELEDRGEGRVLLDFGQIVKANVFEVLSARDEVIAKRPEAVRAYLEGFYETIRYMKANRDATIRFMTKAFDMAESTAAKTYTLDIENLSADGTIPDANLNGLAESAVVMKLADAKPPVARFYDGRFVPVRLAP